jgi:hypothetical protein
MFCFSFKSLIVRRRINRTSADMLNNYVEHLFSKLEFKFWDNDKIILVTVSNIDQNMLFWNIAKHNSIRILHHIYFILI